jgi:hypothetical protein
MHPAGFLGEGHNHAATSFLGPEPNPGVTDFRRADEVVEWDSQRFSDGEQQLEARFTLT